MRQWLLVVWERLRSSYWFIPSLMAVVSVGLAHTMLRLDVDFRDEALREQGWVYSGGSQGARAVLSTISGSIVTVAGTTFSITIAALSLASAQFGPRLLRNFMRDTGNQVVLGTFTSTYLYCLLVLRTVRGLDDNTYVPHISVTVGVALAVISLGVLIYFIHHISQSIQVSHLVSTVGEELQSAVKRIFPTRMGEGAEASDIQIQGATPVLSTGDGYLQAIDERSLLTLCEQADVQIQLLRRPGHYVSAGLALALCSPNADCDVQNNIRSAFALGRDRTPQQDAEFAFLQLAEVALRALSPGINDPFTAMMCLDRITSAMFQLAGRTLPAPVRCDASGVPRVLAYPWSYHDLVTAGYRHIREAAKGKWQVTEHLRKQLQLLLDSVHNPEFRAAIRKELEALD